MITPFNVLMSFGDIYDDLKTKNRERLRISQYAEFFYTSLMEMFTYDGLPESLPKRFLENILLRTGSVFVWKDGDELICSTGTLGGEVDAYGLGTKAIATALNGHTKEGTRDKDIIFGINNDLQSPETFILWLIHICNEIDLSLDLNVLYSRYLPAPLVRDDKTKHAFDEYIQKLTRGEMTAILSDNVLNNELGINEQVLEITDVNRIDKVQYLSRLRDDMLKQFYNRYGQALQTQNKSAQQTTDEIHGMDSASFIIPLNMYKCRLDMVNKINSIFGTDITVRFSDPWRFEIDRYINDNLQGTDHPDETPTTEPATTDDNPTTEPTPSYEAPEKELAETGQEEAETKQEEVETIGKQSEGKQDETVVESVDNSVDNSETLTDSEAVEAIKTIVDLTDEKEGEEDD